MQSPEEIHRQLLEKSANDPEFRQRLVDDPKEVISREFDIKLPDNVQIVVHESDWSKLHLSLPPTDRMHEEHLEQYWGGSGCSCGTG